MGQQSTSLHLYHPSLPVHRFVTEVIRQFWLPPIPIGQQFLLVVQQLFVRLSRILKIGSLYDGINRTSFLTKATVYALCHIDVVPCCSSRAVFSFFCLDSNRLSWTNSFAQFASDTSFFTSRISTQGMFTSKPWTYRSLFKRVVYGHFWFKEYLER
jgi:hypothetical protein